MQNLLGIGDVQLIYKYRLVEHAEDTDACKWMGVRCANGYVHKINWGGPDVHFRETYRGPMSFLIWWLPPSVCQVDMSGLSISSRFLTNLLPRAMQTACFDFCGLFGSFEGDGLPRDLRHLSLRGNMLSGSVFLRNLPRKLTTLNLYQNPIEHVYVANGDLPGGLNMILFANADKNVQFVSLDEKKVDERVRMAKGMEFIQ